MGFDNQGYQYNTKYELLLNRWGTGQEKHDILGMTYAEQGYNLAGSPGDYLPRIKLDLMNFVQQQPAEQLSDSERKAVLKQIADAHSSLDVYTLIDQLDPDTDTGSGSGSGNE